MAIKKEIPLKEALIVLYEKHQNYTSIARFLDVSRTTVKNKFKEYEIYAAPGARKVATPSRGELDKLIAGGMSNERLAGRYNVHVTTISLWLRTYNLLSKRARAHFRKMAEKVVVEKVELDLKFPASEFRNVPQFGALVEHANQSGGCYVRN